LDQPFEDFRSLYMEQLFAMWRQLKDHYPPLCQYLDFEAFTHYVYACS
jgi:hypothetical protein